MRYQFTPPDPRAAGTTIVVSDAVKVRLDPGNNEMDDDLWNQIKTDSTVKTMLESEVLRVLMAPASNRKAS